MSIRVWDGFPTRIMYRKRKPPVAPTPLPILTCTSTQLPKHPLTHRPLNPPPTPRPQVYRGRLRTTGEEVAVKVQRPGIGDSIALDMVLLRRLMAVIDNNIPQASCQAGCDGKV